MRSILAVSLLFVFAELSGCGGAYSPQQGAHGGKSAPSPATSATPVIASSEAGVAGQPPGGGDQSEPPGGPAKPAKVRRQIIYTADMRLIVEEFSGVPEKVAALVRQHDGIVANSQLSGYSGSPRYGTWKIRIPVGGYGDFLTAARSLGEVQNVTTDSQDVSEEYYDVEARIRNKRKEETRLLKHLEDNTGKLEEILAVEREISRVREELERMEGRMRVLKDLTALTTITLRIDEIKGYIPSESPTLAARVERALSGSLSAMRISSEAALVAVVALAPWLIMMAIPASASTWLVRRLRRGRSIWVK